VEKIRIFHSNYILYFSFSLLPVKLIIFVFILSKAAHCILECNCSKKITVLLGRFNLSDSSESFGLQRNVIGVTIHDDYMEPRQKMRGDADIAILNLNETITFTNFIQPICLPHPSVNEVGVIGVTVGFGKSETNIHHEYTPKHYESTPISLYDCLLKGEPYNYLVSTRTFCSVGQNVVACKGTKYFANT
jgi:hypothetical protein